MAGEQAPQHASDGADVEQQMAEKTDGASVSEKRLSHADEDSTTPDQNIVDWEGLDDPQNPRNWSAKAKVVNTLLVIVLVLLTPLASSMFAPGVPDVLKEFHSDSTTIAELVVSIYILGFAIGPLIISPLSEIYGRWPVYSVCNVGFLVFTIACAVSTSLSQLIVFRFFAGCFGVCPVVLGGATIADLIVQEKRGTAISLFAMGPLLGPVIGPVCGAFLAADKGWRWTFWVIAIAYGACTITFTIFCRETFAPVLLARKTARLRKETGNHALRSAQDSGLSKKDYITRALVRPFKMFIFSPIVALMGIYIAIIYGVLYLLYTTYTFVFEEYYNFSASTVGLTFIGSGIGMLCGLFLTGFLSDKILVQRAKQNGGNMLPEFRLITLMWTAWLIPAGLFIYGWTVQNHIQYIAPLFGTLVFGVGIIVAMICVQQYLIDAYTLHAASAIAANTVLRSIVGGLLPLAGLDVYDALGFGWGNSLIAFIALAMIPIPFAFYFYGERIRKRGNLHL